MTPPLSDRQSPAPTPPHGVSDEVRMTCPLDRDGTVTKTTILQNLASHLSLPEHFGHNWDAAFDSLLDWAETHPGCARLVFVHSPTACVNAQDMDTFLDLIGDANAHLVRQGNPLRFEACATDPAKDTDADPPGG